MREPTETTYRVKDPLTHNYIGEVFWQSDEDFEGWHFEDAYDDEVIIEGPYHSATAAIDALIDAHRNTVERVLDDQIERASPYSEAK